MTTNATNLAASGGPERAHVLSLPLIRLAATTSAAEERAGRRALRARARLVLAASDALSFALGALSGLALAAGVPIAPAPLVFLVSAPPVSMLARAALRRFVTIPLARSLARRGARRTLVVGATARAGEAAASIAAAGSGIDREEIVGFVAGSGAVEVPRDRYLGELHDLHRLSNDRAVDRIVIFREDLDKNAVVHLAQWCQQDDVEALAASRDFEVFEGRARTERVGGLPAYRACRSKLESPRAQAAKRVFDAVCGTLALVALAPLFIGIALAVKMSSPGPIFHKQKRIGRDGVPFTFLKFRSMIAGAQRATHERSVRAWMTGEPVSRDESGRGIYKLVDDPRVTRIGRFIRRTSLDELPQLLNVLRGEMSLVGPRPCMPYELEQYEEWQRRRLDVIPGCTGLWQVTARSEVGFDDMVLLDLHYVANWSLWQDIKLMLATVPVMVFGRGGH